jgi:hypothetical protein
MPAHSLVSFESAACGSRACRAYRRCRRRGRVAEGGGLLNRYRLVKAYRGFESLRLRQFRLQRLFSVLIIIVGRTRQPHPALSCVATIPHHRSAERHLRKEDSRSFSATAQARSMSD